MGKRRARCLRKLGYSAVHAYDPRPDRREEIAGQALAESVADLDTALAQGADLALVCTPPHTHADVLKQVIGARIPVFCEAPLTLTLADADAAINAAEQAGVFLAPSCTYLHNAIHERIAHLLEEGALGRPMLAISHVGQHVADWHPYEDYRGFYASKRAEGGMCFDMLPHEFHLFTEFFGPMNALSCMARRRNPAIESDTAACDVYDILADMASGVSLVLHQDVVQRPWGEFRKIACERGCIEWNWRSLRVARYGGPGFLDAPAWEGVALPCYDFEDMYVQEIAHVIEAMAGHAPYRMPPRREREILRLALACEESSNTGRQISLT